MIQQDIVQLTQRLKDFDLHITIETAGTVYQPVTCDLMSISPKLANSTPTRREGGRWAAQHDRLRYQPDVLKQLMAEYPYQLKFVVSDPDDLAEIETILTETDADRSRVVLMPEGTRSRDALRARPLAGGYLQAGRLPLRPAAPHRYLRQPKGSLTATGGL